MAIYRGLTYRGVAGGMLSGGGNTNVKLRLLSFGSPETVDVNNNECTMTKSNVVLQEGSSGTTDSVRRIKGGTTGDILIVRCATAITLEDGVGLQGGLRLQATNNYLVASPSDTIWFVKSAGIYWLELGRSVNS
jgi:Tfp pilus assembly major pilin PilA